MNVVQRAIENAYRRVEKAGGPIEDANMLALGTAFLVLRGGRALEWMIEEEIACWCWMHGQPNREKLQRWAEGLDLEAGIAEQALRVRLIRTFAGDMLDTVYERHGKKWRAILPDGQATPFE